MIPFLLDLRAKGVHALPFFGGHATKVPEPGEWFLRCSGYKEKQIPAHTHGEGNYCAVRKDRKL